MSVAEGQPPWAGRVPRNRIERLYESESRGILDEDLVDEVGYALLARCESILAITRGHGGTPVCPGCLKTMERQEECIRCTECNWSTTIEAFRNSYKKKHLHAGRMEPFIEAYVDDFTKARNSREKMLLIDIFIHRCHGDYEETDGKRPGAINLIGGKPREVVEFLDRLGGIRRSALDSEADHDTWVAKVKRECRGGWRSDT